MKVNTQEWLQPTWQKQYNLWCCVTVVINFMLRNNLQLQKRLWRISELDSQLFLRVLLMLLILIPLLKGKCYFLLIFMYFIIFDLLYKQHFCAFCKNIAE